MEAAKNRIERISSEQSGRHRELVEAEVWLHPFIRGGHDANIENLKAKFKINAIDVPPRDANKNEIIVRGPEDAAKKCAAEIKVFVAEKMKKCTKLDISVDTKQHRFVIGKYLYFSYTPHVSFWRMSFLEFHRKTLL